MLSFPNSFWESDKSSPVPTPVLGNEWQTLFSFLSTTQVFEIQVLLLHTSGARKKRNARQIDFTFWDCNQTFPVIFLLFLLDFYCLREISGFMLPFSLLDDSSSQCFIADELGTWLTKLVLQTWVFPPAKNLVHICKHKLWEDVQQLLVCKIRAAEIGGKQFESKKLTNSKAFKA